MAAYVMTSRYYGLLSLVTIATIVIYIALTVSISNWRIAHRGR
ncbi:MAG: hypothetical protein WDM85_07290 [Caulobacteraceae bacterium]